MQLYYNTGTNKQYNGNIAYQYWGTPGSLSKNYTYSYDFINRLAGGTSSDNNNETGITYDVMGNITALNRYQAGGLIDQLTYTYSGSNKVQSIADASGSSTGLVNGTTTYSYDGNGNILSNSNTVLNGQNKSYTYNLLNIPQTVTVPIGTVIYTYDAEGNKLRKVSVLSGTTKTTDYIAGIEYDNSTTAIGFIQTEEGRATPNGTGYDYQYYLGDNLGNTRNTFGTKTGTAVSYQQDDYYPFGMEINRSVLSPKNEYLYNKKELQEELQQYDYGARFYDPVIARWGVADPMTEVDRAWSPYNYARNNPVRFIDPDGMTVANVGYGVDMDIPSSDSWSASGIAKFNGLNFTLEAFGNENPEIAQTIEEGKRDAAALYDQVMADDGDDDCCLTARDHTAGKPARKNPATFSQVSYERRKLIEHASRPFQPFATNWKGPDEGAVTELVPERPLIALGLTIVTDLWISRIFTTAGETGVLDGSFSISNWEGYPTAGSGLKPSGPFRLLEGSEYDAARDLANKTNLALRRKYPELFKGFEVHEIHTVKFGGSPTDLSNKILLTKPEHNLYNTYWKAMQRELEK